MGVPLVLAHRLYRRSTRNACMQFSAWETSSSTRPRTPQSSKIWNQDVSNGAKLAQTYNQTVKIVKNGIDTYNLAMQMSQRVQNKQRLGNGGLRGRQ